jgi:hypothetical protein
MDRLFDFLLRRQPVFQAVQSHLLLLKLQRNIVICKNSNSQSLKACADHDLNFLQIDQQTVNRFDPFQLISLKKIR